MKEYITDDVIADLLLKNYFRLIQLVLPATESRLVAFCLSLVSPVWQWLAPLTIEKDLKPAFSSNSMDEDRSQKDAALSHSDGGPLRQVRDPGGLESEGLTLRSGSVLKGRSPHISQISDPQAMVESSAVIAQGQAALSQTEASQPFPMQSAQRRTFHWRACQESISSLMSLRLSHLLLLLA